MRTEWQATIVLLLIVLLAVVATLQYRWLGEVSNAERERMRATLRTRASDFGEAFDRELTRMYGAFQVDPTALDRDPNQAIGDVWARWEQTTAARGLVDAIYLIETRLDGTPTISLKRFDPSDRILEPADWPAALVPWREHRDRTLTGNRATPFFVPASIDASIPALVIAVPTLKDLGDKTRGAYVPDPSGPLRLIVVTLNADQLRDTVVAPLVAKFFGSGPTSDYIVTIVRRADPATIVYSSDPAAPVDERTADVSTPLFDVRSDELSRIAAADATLPTGAKGRFAITIFRRATPSNEDLHLSLGGDTRGGWQARIRGRSGSLDAIVEQSRRRNLAISFGVLLLLVASFALIVASALRQQRLARQQMQFVAAVSHELRTPLTVIRAAGENLADGVVDGRDQVRQYGSLIEREGRRLTDMVERVLAFAGIRSGAAIYMRDSLDLQRLVAEAVSAVRTDDVRVHVQAPGALPSIVGDDDALRSALQNVIGNAIKYSSPSSGVDVTLGATADRLTIVVSDRGLGIDADDLPNIFKPFFRGRRAIDAQIRGTGVGLSVVRHIIEAHGGDVRAESGPGVGTTITIELPVPRPTGQAVSAPASTRDVSA